MDLFCVVKHVVIIIQIKNSLASFFISLKIVKVFNLFLSIMLFCDVGMFALLITVQNNEIRILDLSCMYTRKIINILTHPNLSNFMQKLFFLLFILFLFGLFSFIGEESLNGKIIIKSLMKHAFQL